MPGIQHSTIIEAPASAVWDTTMDLVNWPIWTPTVRQVTLISTPPVSIGSIAIVEQPGLGKARWCVTELAPGRRFVWETRVLGVRMIASHEISEQNGFVENNLGIEFSGWLAGPMNVFLRKKVLATLERENAGLKVHCESLQL